MEGYRWQQDPARQNLFKSEMETLRRGLGGDFRLIQEVPETQSQGRVKVLGFLKVDGQEQGVEITFPYKYPYSAPKIKPAAFMLNGENVQGLQYRNFQKGNQYSDHSMCLHRKDVWSEELGIGWSLRRTQKWLKSALSPEGFKPEEIIEEFPPLMPLSGQVLIPDGQLFKEGSRSGTFVLSQFKPNHYILEQNNLPNSPFALSVGREAFQYFIFETELSLKERCGGDLGQLPEIINQEFGENLLEGSQPRNIALHFPEDKTPWHFFKIGWQKTGAGINLNLSYYLGQVVSQSLFHRTKGIFDQEFLKDKTVTVIGLGAIGGDTVTALAKNGVGKFELFDNDQFEVGNSVRHAADLYYIGERKTEVVKQLILRSNPNAIVNAYPVDVLDDAGLLEKSLSESDLCLVLTAEDSLDYFINDNYIRQFNIPFIFARVSAGAVSGSIQIVDSSSPCLRCLSSKGVDKLPKPKGAAEYAELAAEVGTCSAPAMPGSGIDTQEVALQVARVGLKTLLKGKKANYPGSNWTQAYWHGPFGSAKQAPFTWETKNYRKDKNCPICR